MARVPVERVGWAEQRYLGARKGRRNVNNGGVAADDDSGSLGKGREEGEIQKSGKGDQRKREGLSAQHGQCGLDGAEVLLFKRIRPASENTGKTQSVLEAQNDFRPTLRKPVLFLSGASRVDEREIAEDTAFFQ
ncbi:MAG: hypothetical protein RLZZ399_2354 [Verrucomicrobiota bacterium]